MAEIKTGKLKGLMAAGTSSSGSKKRVGPGTPSVDRLRNKEQKGVELSSVRETPDNFRLTKTTPEQQEKVAAVAGLRDEELNQIDAFIESWNRVTDQALATVMVSLYF